MARRAINQYNPDIVSPPGETLQETLDALGMTQVELAERMGRTPKLINEIVQGKAAISPETALQLERVLGTPAHFWNKREQQYRDFLARQNESNRLDGHLEWLGRLPLKDMIRFGWVRKCQDRIEQLREVLNFFGVATPDQWEVPVAMFRQSPTFQTHPEAVAVWLREGERQGRDLHCAPFDAKRFQQALRTIRSLTAELPEDFASQMVALCAEAGVALVFVPAPEGARVSGAARWLTHDKALIQLSLRHKSDDHLWFSFFHEAGHILKHGKRAAFVDGDDGERSAVEQEANAFAADFLIPPRSYQRFLASTPKPYIGKDAIRAFAAEEGIAPGIVVGRLQHDRHIPFRNCNELKRTLEWAGEPPEEGTDEP